MECWVEITLCSKEGVHPTLTPVFVAPQHFPSHCLTHSDLNRFTTAALWTIVSPEFISFKSSPHIQDLVKQDESQTIKRTLGTGFVAH